MSETKAKHKTVKSKLTHPLFTRVEEAKAKLFYSWCKKKAHKSFSLGMNSMIDQVCNEK